MKLAIVFGGFAGFVLVTVAGFVVHRDPATILLEGGIGCVVGALLFRWLHRVLVRNIQSSLHERRQARAQEAASAATKKTPVAQATKS